MAKGAEKVNIDPEKLLCPKCNKSLNNDDHKCNKIPPGDYEGDGGELGDEIVKVYYANDFSTHPFFIKNEKIKKKNSRNGIEAHHLISSSSVRYEEKYAALIRMLGYSINHRKNGVLIPTFMQTACAFGVPLHKGGHKATFILSKYLVKEEKSIGKWKFEIPASQEMQAIFSGYDEFDEIAQLNYEDYINEIVRGVCKKYAKQNICDVGKRFEKAKKFIIEMDKKSQVVFKNLSTFQWVLASDGLDYAPGGIGCCNCKTLKSKRIKIANSLKDNSLNADGNVKEFWTTVLSSPDIVEKIKKKKYVCVASVKSGVNTKKHYKNNESTYFKERENITDFQEFKEKNK